MKIVKQLAVLGLLALSNPIFAHGSMMQTVPADGAMLMEPLEQVELNFGVPVQLVKLHVVNSRNEPVDLGFKANSEAKESFSIRMPMLTSDEYKVKWMIVGGDGHKMTGSFGFMQH